MRRGWASTARKRRWHAQARSRGSAEVAHRFTRQAAQESALPLHSGLKVRELLGAPRGYARVSIQRHLAHELMGSEGAT